MNKSANDQLSSQFLLGESGPFAMQDRTFAPRTGQIVMAELIETAIERKQHRVIEAPSGSGKTLAYLIPLLLSGKKSLIATASHALQEQLVYRDIPSTQKILHSDRKVVLLKGRRNYLCPHHLAQTLNKGRYKHGSIQQSFSLVAQRFRETGQGDLSIIASDIPDHLHPQITSSREECASSACAYYEQCPFYTKLAHAKSADLIVINHHLLVSDWISAVLQDDCVVVVDEAHRLIEIGQTLTACTLSSLQMIQFFEDCWIVIKRHASEYSAVLEYLDQCKSQIKQWGKQLPLNDRYQASEHRKIAANLQQWLSKLEPWLASQKERASEFSALLQRLRSLVTLLKQVQSQSGLCLVEARANSFVLQSIPPSFANVLAGFELDLTWIFTSATFSIAGEPSQSLRLLGLTSKHYHTIRSELDYVNCSLLYTPPLNKTPEEEGYYEAFCCELIPFIRLIPGRVLLLFSSHRALQRTARYLIQTLAKKDDVSVLVHGQESNTQLIHGLKTRPNAILLGTGSFWEGLDLNGIQLRAVVIDKLPFASPDDPVLKLRSQHLSQHGVDSFQALLLPDAVIRLRQGYGRLLRRLSDKGVIMLADPRINTKAYGQVFIDSLPPMRRVDNLDSVEAFFQEKEDVIGSG